MSVTTLQVHPGNRFMSYIMQLGSYFLTLALSHHNYIPNQNRHFLKKMSQIKKLTKAKSKRLLIWNIFQEVFHWWSLVVRTVAPWMRRKSVLTTNAASHLLHTTDQKYTTFVSVSIHDNHFTFSSFLGHHFNSAGPSSSVCRQTCVLRTRSVQRFTLDLLHSSAYTDFSQD